MYQNKRIGAILLMAGVGSRFGSEVPKQFHLLQGIPLYLHTLDFFLNRDVFDEILLVCHPDWIEEVRHVVPPFIQVIVGGSTRQESSWLGIQGFSCQPDIVMVHDAVRPFLTEEILINNLSIAIQEGAVDTCIPSADTLVFAPQGDKIVSIPNRAHYLRGQTPQTFRYDWLLDAHKKALQTYVVNATDDCRLVLEAGYPVHVVMGSESNLKITTSFDLQLAEKLLLLTGVVKR